MARSPRSLVSYIWCLVVAEGAVVDLAEWSSAGWFVQNDGVMGGRSSGNLQVSDSGARFEGSINLDGGGFASFRRDFGWFGERNLRDYAGLWVEVDALAESSLAPVAIHVELDDASERSGFGAAMAIPPGPAGSTYSVFLPFSWFRKQLLRSCRDCILNPGRVTGVGIVVLYQEGFFSFRVRKIYAVSSESEVPSSAGRMPTLTTSDSDVWKMIRASILRGSYAWNQGYPEQCGALYNSTAFVISSARNISETVQSIARAATSYAEQFPLNLGNNAAWIYRRSFDAISAAYDGSAPPPESRYPQVAHGDWVRTAMSGGSVQPLPVSDLANELQQQMVSGAPGQFALRSLGLLFVGCMHFLVGLAD